MTQTESRKFLIDYLLNERGESISMPCGETDQRRLLRSLLNVRLPQKTDGRFLKVQDDYLQQELKLKGITDWQSLTPLQENLYLWQGDITTLKCDCIVNAANSQMLGCFCPCHGCIDNAIHTYAGVQLRAECALIMQKQGHEERVGQAKITNAYNLPCRHVIHTVGPVVYGTLTGKNEDDLAKCYLSCLSLAKENNLKSIAFCCISTGEFHFPAQRAAEIAVATVKEFNLGKAEITNVIFNVFKNRDYEIYAKLLGKSK